jgi:16S rRNA processing protein RimM
MARSEGDDTLGTGPAGTGDVVAVGRIGPPRGVRGDVFVEPWTDTPEERFAAGAVLRTAAGPLTVEASAITGGKLVVRFAGTADRSGAESLRGRELYVAAADRAAIDDPDEFYDTELVGLQARLPGGEALGPVTDVLHAGGASYLVVDVAGRDRLVPFVAAIVPTVDLDAGVAIVDPPEGLFEL